jgi:enoyl-CoA hydratase/carnithine racemase
MSEGRILATTLGHVRVISIDRPRARNALTPDMLEAIAEAIVAAGAEASLRAVLIRGHEETPFSAGYDLGALPDERRLTEADARELQRPIRELCTRLRECPHPVIGAVRRYAIGAALDVLAHCDLRVAETGARFSLPAARVGVAYPLEGVTTLAAAMGPSRAARLLLLAEEHSAEELAGSGFLHRVFPEGGFEAGIETLAGDLDRLAPLALRALKRALVCAGADRPPEAEAAALYRALAETLDSADGREGPSALREKRPPRFRGA